jgi:protoporphyrinogen oxidase
MSPRLGAGQLYEKMEAIVTDGGGEVLKDVDVVKVSRDGFRVDSITYRRADGTTGRLEADYFLSSAPLTDLLEQLDPPPPEDVMTAARSLRYRHHVGVKLVVQGDPPFADNWIYVHASDVKMARIANYSSFSKEMGAAPGMHPLTVEYFCFAGDEIWERSDAQLIELAIGELAAMGIARGRVTGSFVVRSEKAYPVIELGFQDKIDVIKGFLDRFENLLPIGRSGMFKYNNQDHAIATGLYAVRTAMNQGRFDPWRVNIDGVYQEGAVVS